jgi:uncharacterized protein (DUF488 family)
MVIWTIGYEKQRIDRFIATLQAAGIRRVIDVRDVAWSHNPSYAKKKLEQSLNKAGIGYTHLQALGNPKAGRDAAKAGETEEFHEVFGVRLAGDEAQAALAQLKAIAGAEKTCMMCLESDPERCHRILICEALQCDGVEVRHLIEPDLFRRAGTR